MRASFKGLTWSWSLLAAATGLCAGCVGVSAPQTQLEVREFQTRTYPVKNAKLVMKAVLNVLQDEGFIVKTADSELGLLTAVKEIDVEDAWVSLLLSLSSSNARWEKVKSLECSINVSEFGEATKVRANFHVKLVDNHGHLITAGAVQDPRFYQDFFSKVDKGVFLEREGL